MRVLVTGLSTYWGGRLAQVLEQEEHVEAIIGIDRRPPKFALERTEFVQVADAHSLIRRIVQAAEIDTVVDTRLVVDSTVTTPKRAHENNVIGTMNILAACSGPDSCVRRLIVRSSASYYDVPLIEEAREAGQVGAPVQRACRQEDLLQEEDPGELVLGVVLFEKHERQIVPLPNGEVLLQPLILEPGV